MTQPTPADERDSIALAIEATNRRWQTTLDTVLDGIITINDRGTIEMVNAAVERLFGYAPEELLGRNVRILMPAPYEAHHDEYLSQYRATKVPKIIGIGRTVEGRRKDGTHFPIQLSVGEAVIDGRTVYTGIIHDITEITRAYSDLERAARSKDEFLASMSHELRTPLNAILGLTEALAEGVYGAVSDEQRRTLASVDDSGRHLLALINDILDLAKINAGHLAIELEPINLLELCQMSLVSVRPQASRKRITLAFTEIDPSISVETDARRLRQILINLLNNAVKFTPDGGRVVLEVRIQEAERAIEFIVEDTGIGIPSDRLGEIFEPFRQIDTKLSRNFEGSGLGLALVVKLVEAFGGSLAVESELGRGSRFSVRVPWNPASSQPSEDVSSSTPPPKRALVIEDSVTDAQRLARFLREMGVEVLLVPDTSNAVKTIREFRPDLIFIDVMLPEESGWAFLARLKADPDLRRTSAVVVSVVDDESRSLGLGATAHIVKPFTRDDVRKVVHPSGGSTEAVRAAVVESSRGKDFRTVLLAEDNEASAKTVGDYLRRNGIQVVLARTGLEAVELANTLSPSAILMDIQMPELDGLEAIRTIRSRESGRRVPIIAVTALAMPGDRERCLAAGADAYLTKPVRLTGLLMALTKAIEGVV